ncbi:MAG TPA: hypothetical protein VIG33_05600 [Pseudobdellovibrionaceae bacterium]|jgi:hypothetical protein
MKKFFAMTALAIILGGNISFANTKVISDSLVNNLSCNSLSIGTILIRIRQEAFSSVNHLPFKNWGFHSGSFKLAACWGMGSTQRKLLYLLRLNEREAPAPNAKSVLDMVRGATLKTLFDKHGSSYLMDENLKAYHVVPISDKNLREEYEHNTGTSFLEVLFKGVDYQLDSFPIHRNLRTEIERSEELHFFRVKNIGMGAGSGPLSPHKNNVTVQHVMNNLRLHRLTLVNLRLTRTIQHVVMAKSFTEDGKGNVWIQAYDSNQPEADQPIYYSKATGHFYAPRIMGSFVGDTTGTDYTHPLGTFIVDEEERAQIEESLLKHYQQLCK